MLNQFVLLLEDLEGHTVRLDPDQACQDPTLLALAVTGTPGQWPAVADHEILGTQSDHSGMTVILRVPEEDRRSWLSLQHQPRSWLSLASKELS